MGTPVRLQKLLAQAGFGSRRACEVFITEGRVSVDGAVVRQLGSKADPDTQVVEFDGRKISGPGKTSKSIRDEGDKVYWILNKPRDVLCTNEDPSGRTLAVQLVPEKRRVYCVGRLDLDTEGLLILTNDGDLTNQLTHPKYGIEKTYLATVDGEISFPQLKKLQAGVHLAEGRTQGAEVRVRKKSERGSTVEIVISEGMNRQVRRMLVKVGLRCRRLKRTAVGPIRLGDLEPGQSRRLSEEELSRLKAAISVAQKRSESAPPEKKFERQFEPAAARHEDETAEDEEDDDADLLAEEVEVEVEDDKETTPLTQTRDRGDATSTKKEWSAAEEEAADLEAGSDEDEDGEDEAETPAAKQPAPRRPERERTERPAGRSNAPRGDRPWRPKTGEGRGRPQSSGGPQDRPWQKKSARPWQEGGDRRREVSKSEARAPRPWEDRGERKPRPDGEKRPWKKRDDRAGRPWQKRTDDRPRSSGSGGEKKPWVKRDDRGGPPDRGARPWEKRDDRGGPPDRGSRPWEKRDDRPARSSSGGGEKRPWEKRDRPGGERPWKKREEGGSARPWEKRDKPARPWEDRGERAPRADRAERPDRGGDRGPRPSRPWEKRGSSAGRPFRPRTEGGGKFRGSGSSSGKPRGGGGRGGGARGD